MVDREAVEELYRMLDTALSEEEKALVIATEIEGQSFKSLAEKWQIPINTLLSKKSRAIKKLVRNAKALQAE